MFIWWQNVLSCSTNISRQFPQQHHSRRYLSSLRVHFRLIPKVNYAVARTQMVELDRNWHQNRHRNRHFFRLCVVNCCDIFVQCDIRASFEMMEKMVTYSGKSRIFYLRFLEGNPKLHSLNSILCYQHGWTSIRLLFRLQWEPNVSYKCALAFDLFKRL